ncbi:MAG: MarC family protein [bacterium]|jgi:multiple antibiotic resistance protein
MHNFWLCFVPLFVAVDAVGVLPMFLALTEGIDQQKLRKVIWQSLITGTLVAIVFVMIGKAVFQLLGITTSDFMVAGGVLLFAISLRDLLVSNKHPDPEDPDSLGAVPVGVPLIVGPAVLTTILLLVDQYGIIPTISAAIMNILLAGIVFHFAGFITSLLGRAGTKAVSKLASLLLAAIAVMMVRKGIIQFMH